MDRKYDVNRVKYFSQWDNKYEPQGTCNFTSAASALTGFGIVGGGGRLPDEIFLKYNPNYSRHAPETIVKIFSDYGISDVFSYATDFEDVLSHLAKKKPVIIHGDFTASGHIILCKQVLSSGLIQVNDSNGKFSAQTGQYNKWLSGENDLWRSASLLKWTNYTLPGVRSVWAHRIG